MTKGFSWKKFRAVALFVVIASFAVMGLVVIGLNSNTGQPTWYEQQEADKRAAEAEFKRRCEQLGGIVVKRGNGKYGFTDDCVFPPKAIK